MAAAQAESLSQTLRSGLRDAGPRVVRNEPRHPYVPTSPRALELTGSGFVKAISDAGLRPVTVYHNLAVAELYEKVRGDVGGRGEAEGGVEAAAASGRGEETR